MKRIGVLIVMLMLFGPMAYAKPMGLETSNKIMALGKVLKTDDRIVEDGKGILDFWYIAFKNNLYYCITTRGVSLYIECYDKN